MTQSRACRVRHGNVLTAVWTLHHPETGRTVTLLGTYHLGDPQYYQEIAALADKTEHAGGLIQSEGTELADATLLTPLTEQEKRALAAKLASDEELTTTREFLAKGGLVPELGTLERRPHWRYPDIDKLSQVRLIGDAYKIPENRVQSKNRTQPKKGTPQHKRSAKREARGKRRVAAIMRFLFRLPLRFVPLTDHLGATSVFRTALTNRQEQNAALDLLEIPGPVNVLAIWGAGHLPGIRAMLERNGFGIVHMRWLTAVTKRAPNFPAETAVEEATHEASAEAAATDVAMPAGADRQDVPAPT